MVPSHKITDLLQAWSNGDSKALEELLPLVDHELKTMAHKFMVRERAGHILQTTALVNEALMRLIAGEKISWESRKHFYSLVARRMRHVLIEYARKQLSDKGGNRADHLQIDEVVYLSTEMSEEIVMLDEALTKLRKLDERKALIVEYRYFGGFTIEDVSEIFGISPASVDREWRFARSWLKREMT